MARNRVFIRGCGIVSAIGTTQQEIALTCHNGIATPGSTTLPHSCERPLPYYALPGETDKISSPDLYKQINAAVDSAIHDAGLTVDEISHLPVFVGSTAGDISDLESHYQHELHHANVDASPLYRCGFGVLAEYIIDRLQSDGQQFTFNTACSSGANALLMATRMVAAGRMDNALVVGVETRNQMSLQGFNTMLLLAALHCQPFDKNRSGTVLGEGIGAIVISRHKPLSSDFSAARPYYCLGGANLTDSVNITSSDSSKIAAVIAQALTETGLHPADIKVIKAHGTSTPANDSAEAQGMRRLFGDQLPPFTSLKPYVGHTLGACGVVETIIMLACIKEHFVPATPGFTTLDETCGCTPLTQRLPFDGGIIMLNHFGFGGNNTSLVIANEP